MITLELRRMDAPEAYSREELYEMLRTVRRHEHSTGWKVPDPPYGGQERALDLLRGRL